MPNIKQFNDILEAANDLPIDDQETLTNILNRRIHDIQRAEIVNDVKSALKEYSRNQCKPTTPDDLMKALIG